MSQGDVLRPKGESVGHVCSCPSWDGFQVREGRPPASAFASRFARMLLHIYYVDQLTKRSTRTLVGGG
jgi:hypothetical protein